MNCLLRLAQGVYDTTGLQRFDQNKAGESRPAPPFFVCHLLRKRLPLSTLPHLRHVVGARGGTQRLRRGPGKTISCSLASSGTAQRRPVGLHCRSSLPRKSRGFRAAETAKYCATTQMDGFVLLPHRAAFTHSCASYGSCASLASERASGCCYEAFIRALRGNSWYYATDRKHGQCLACVAEAIQVRSQAQCVALEQSNVF